LANLNLARRALNPATLSNQSTQPKPNQMKIEKRQVIRITKDIWTVQVLVGKDAEYGKPVYQIESKHNSLQAAQAAKAAA
jgi:hypothetical protein